VFCSEIPGSAVRSAFGYRRSANNWRKKMTRAKKIASRFISVVLSCVHRNGRRRRKVFCCVNGPRYFDTLSQPIGFLLAVFLLAFWVQRFSCLRSV
jgi:hypothetical protein